MFSHHQVRVGCVCASFREKLSWVRCCWADNTCIFLLIRIFWLVKIVGWCCEFVTSTIRSRRKWEEIVILQKKFAWPKNSKLRVREMRLYSWSQPSTAECPSVAVWRMTTGTSVVTTTSCRGLTASARVNRAASWKWQQHCGETYPGLVVQLYLDMHKCRTSVKKVRVSHSWSYYRKL